MTHSTSNVCTRLFNGCTTIPTRYVAYMGWGAAEPMCDSCAQDPRFRYKIVWDERIQSAKATDETWPPRSPESPAICRCPIIHMTLVHSQDCPERQEHKKGYLA
jgi:hypothetical protein